MDSPSDLLEAGRDAMQRHAWEDAYQALSEADRLGSLSGADLGLLSDAAWFTGRPDAIVEALERAYAASLDEGDRIAAAKLAYRLAQQYAGRLAFPVATAWMTRAEELSAEDPEHPVHGHIAWSRGMIAMNVQGDFADALGRFETALAIAERTGDRDLFAKSLHDKGTALCALGRAAEGLALMDEAMVAAVGGELGPVTTGYVYCAMIAACSHRGDYGRAAEWSEATLRWCERYPLTAFEGTCRIHRAELFRLHGDFPQAESEARRACEQLPTVNHAFGLPYAFYEIGEVRRRLGDLAGAREAFGRTHELGGEPEPGMSLVLLAEGKLEAASAGVRRALADERKDPLSRLRLLAAEVQISVAIGDVARAEAASAEIDAIVPGHEAEALHAIAARSRGAVRLAKGDAEGALAELRRAREGWQKVDAPFEVAEIRVLMGSAYHALGDDEGAILELKAARAAFERLGARGAAESVGAMLGELASSVAPERVRRAFLFSDIVKSTDLVSAIGDEAWEDLLAWHDQTLGSLFSAQGGEVVHHTGDGFFVAFADASAALGCAVAIQRVLADHRRAHGFAPQVRIGVHVAEATQRGFDYSGGEVHKAARIAAAAGGGEILASVEAIEEAGNGFATSEPHTIAAKGIPEPVQVSRVEWRSPAKT